MFTAYVDTVVESLSNFRVHVNQKLLFSGQLFVSEGNLLSYPVTKWLSNNSIDYVD